MTLSVSVHPGGVKGAGADCVIDQRQQLLQPFLPTAAVEDDRNAQGLGPVGQLGRLGEVIAIEQENVGIFQGALVDGIVPEFAEIGIGIDNTALTGGEVDNDGGKDRWPSGLVGAIDQMHLVVGKIRLGDMGQGVLAEAGDQRCFVAESGKGDRGIGRRTTGIGKLPFCLEFFIFFKVMGDIVYDIGCCQTEEDAFLHGMGHCG